MADQSREEKLRAARETFKQLQKKKAGGKSVVSKPPKPGAKEEEPKEPEPSTAPESSSPPLERTSLDSRTQEPPAPAPVEEVAPVVPDTSAAHEAELQALRDQLTVKDSLVGSLQEQISAFNVQEDKYRREINQHVNSIGSKDKEISTLKSTDSEKDSTLSSLQLEIGQLQSQLNALKESSGQAPTPEQLAVLKTERDTLQTTLKAKESDLKSLQTQHDTLKSAHAALEKDTKTTQEALKSLQADHAKLKETHTAEIQKSRMSHSRAAELQLENKTLFSRVEELKQKLVTLTSEKLELVERSEAQEAKLFRLRKAQKESVAAGGGGTRERDASVEMNTELDALIEGEANRRAIRETNQRRYSQFVGQGGGTGDEETGESLREVNERRLKRGKDSGEFGREREMGFVVDLISGGGGCGMCTGEVLVL